MQDMDHDLQQVFYGEDFALRLLRVRPGADDLEFRGIVGVADEDALENRVITTARSLQCPATVDLRADDAVRALEASPTQGIAAGDKFRVLDVPERINDGAELEALLGSVKS